VLNRTILYSLAFAKVVELLPPLILCLCEWLLLIPPGCHHDLVSFALRILSEVASWPRQAPPPAVEAPARRDTVTSRPQTAPSGLPPPPDPATERLRILNQLADSDDHHREIIREENVCTRAVHAGRLSGCAHAMCFGVSPRPSVLLSCHSKPARQAILATQDLLRSAAMRSSRQASSTTMPARACRPQRACLRS
jgi:hypothetical protein